MNYLPLDPDANVDNLELKVFTLDHAEIKEQADKVKEEFISLLEASLSKI